MEFSMAHLPGWVIVMDYILGLIMWTLIGRVAMNIFLPLHSDFFFMRVFVKYTDPIINLFGPVTPRFLVEPLIPLYVAWFFICLDSILCLGRWGIRLWVCSLSHSRERLRRC